MLALAVAMRFSRPRFFYGLIRLARSIAAIGCLLPLAALALGCVHRGYVPLGTGQVTSGGPVASAAPGAGGLSPTVVVPADLPEADLRVDYQLWLPRAMEVSWQLRCGQVVVEGEAGETFEAYRTRRLAELVAERERARQQAAQVGSLIGGAVLGQPTATVAATAPGASAQAGVVVDGAAVGAAAGASMVSTEVALAPDDVGQGYRHGHVELAAVPAGTCTMAVAPRVRPVAPPIEGEAVIAPVAIDPALLVGTFSVARRDDPGKRRALVADRGAIELRGTLRIALVATGADADLEAARARNRARAEAAAAVAQAEFDARAAVAQAERDARAAHLQVALDAHMELETQARVRARVRREGAAMTRSAVIAYLGTCGGDVHHRERLAAEARAQAEFEVELTARRQRAAIDVRGQLHAWLIVAGADPGQRARQLDDAARAAEAQMGARIAYQADLEARTQAQFDARIAYRAALEARSARRLTLIAEVRGQLTASLIAGGARLRSPMPPIPYEEPGPPPVSGLVWIGGAYEWSGGSWAWTAGRWEVAVDGGFTVELGGAGGRVPVPPVAYEPPTPSYVPPTPSYVPPTPSSEPARPPVRDHRTPSPTVAPSPPPPPPRPVPPAPAARPQTRDHRDGH